MRGNHWIGGALVAAVAMALGVGVLRPQTVAAQATAKSYLTVATGSQETPSTDTPAVAFARFTLGTDNKLQYEVYIASTLLKGPFTAMHLHRGKAGAAGPVVYPLAAPTADKPGVSVGSVDFMAADQADLDSQGFYLNIHTEAFPGGEIRGQVVVSPPTLNITTKP